MILTQSNEIHIAINLLITMTQVDIFDLLRIRVFPIDRRALPLSIVGDFNFMNVC